MLRTEHSSLRQGLVGCWVPSLGASGLTLIDRSGRNNHGTLTNMAGQDNWRADAGGLSLAFDNTNDRVPTPIVSTLADFTACAWFVDFGTKNGTFRRVMDKTFNNGFWIGLNGIGGAGTYGGGIRQTTGQLGIFLDLPSTSSRWSFIAITRQGTTQNLYLANGTALATASQTVSGTLTSADPLQIGNTVSGTGDTWNGLLDDLRLYNRTLAPAEILLLASRRGIGLTPLPDRAAGLPRKLSVNVGGDWRPADAYVHNGTAFRLSDAKINVAGVWK
jgi:hypothetical protein